jgi:hypothetical protein
MTMLLVKHFRCALEKLELIWQAQLEIHADILLATSKEVWTEDYRY